MLTNDDSKIKYPSFRIDDILKNDFRSHSDDDLHQTNDEPINLSSLKCKKEFLNSSLQQSIQMNENSNENQFKNLKSISSISSSSPTLSVGSSDSPSFNQFLPISKSPIIDQLIKCNLSNTNDFKANLLNAFSDGSNHHLSLSANLSNPFFINQYPQSTIENFYLKLNSNKLTGETINHNKTLDYLSEDISLNINDALKKLQHQNCKCCFAF